MLPLLPRMVVACNDGLQLTPAPMQLLPSQGLCAMAVHVLAAPAPMLPQIAHGISRDARRAAERIQPPAKGAAAVEKPSEEEARAVSSVGDTGLRC